MTCTRIGTSIPQSGTTDRLLGMCGVGEEIVDYVEDRLGHDRRYSIDTAKIRSLGLKPERDLTEALGATVDWYRDNRWWWEPFVLPC